jgi:hypothetical protein
MEGVARLQRELLVPVAARRTELLGGTDRVVADASRIGQHDGVEILDDDLRIDIYRRTERLRGAGSASPDRNRDQPDGLRDGRREPRAGPQTSPRRARPGDGITADRVHAAPTRNRTSFARVCVESNYGEVGLLDRRDARNLITCLVAIVVGTALCFVGMWTNVALVVIFGVLAISTGTLGVPFVLLLGVRDGTIRLLRSRWRRSAK